MNSTGQAWLTGAEQVVNEAVKNTYLISRFLKGKGMDEVIQGGKNITDELMLDDQSTAVFAQPNDTFSWSNPQVLTQWTSNWRFLVDHMSWTDQEIDLQVNSGMTRGARHEVYKRVKRSKEQRMWTSAFNKMETALWAVPDKSKQESADGTDPYSLPAFVNEYTNGLFAVPDAGAGLPGGNWTVVKGIDPTASGKTRWKPQLELYGSASATADNAAVATRNAIQAMDRMWLKIKFQPPGTRQEYFENAALNRQFIAASRIGISHYSAMMRASQDLYASVSRQDPAYVNPAYAGIDLLYVSELDTAALYLDAAATPDALLAEVGAATDNSGPRYYFLNGNYIKTVFHEANYFDKKPSMRHPNQPFTTIQPVSIWYNLVCRSRQRQGLVAPSGAVITA